MAVDVKQLRIGSHVMWNGKRRKVDAITEDSIAFRIADTEQKMYDSATIESVEPIAITPELLKELGVEWRDNTYWERWFNGSFEIEKKEESHYFDYNSEIRLEYLHELEALYSMIYDDELIPD